MKIVVKLKFLKTIFYFGVYAFYRNCIIYDPIVTSFINQTFAKLLFLTLRLLRKNTHLPLSSAVVIDLHICSQHELFSVYFWGSVNPGQTDPRGAV